MQKQTRTWQLATAFTTFILLAIVQCTVKPPLLIGERIYPGGGWIQIIFAAFLSSWLFLKMYPRNQRAKWRQRIWITFSIIFFGQLFLGIVIDSFFLMTGKLHFPIPGLIPMGMIYRWELSFMPILFFITIILSGGAWCSQLCYFGAFDSLAANKKHKKQNRFKRIHRWYVLGFFMIIVIILRSFSFSPIYATIAASIAGLLGIIIIFLFSQRSGQMIHCSYYCPAGLLVSYLKFLSPWRLRINSNCINCQACTKKCHYGALEKRDIERKRPAINCTYCGDCLTACHHNAIEYRFANCPPNFSEKLWLCVNMVLFTCFLTIARI